jgi:hypothetical protein
VAIPEILLTTEREQAKLAARAARASSYPT